MANHICPWWVGYLLANPLRRIFENPDKLLAPFVCNGMTVIDYGCGMGFFTIPLARLVGPKRKSNRRGYPRKDAQWIAQEGPENWFIGQDDASCRRL